MAKSSQKSPGKKASGATTRKSAPRGAIAAAAKPKPAVKAVPKPKPKPKASPKPGPKAQPAATPAANPSASDSPGARAKAAIKAAFDAALDASPDFDDLDDFDDVENAGGDGRGDRQSGAQNGAQANSAPMGDSENYLDFLSRMFTNVGGNAWNNQQFDSQQFDGMTQGMSMVLGSGPAFAALESMLANTSAQSAVLMNAVQTQRQLDQVGLCCTSACVKQLLNMNNNQDQD